MKILDRKGFDPALIEDPAPFTVEISRYQKYGELLKNSVENYPLRDKIVLVMKDLAWVEGCGDGGGGKDFKIKTRGKLQVCDMDYSTYFKDTEGNIIGLWEAIR